MVNLNNGTYYKYRSLKDFERFVDIIVKNRLYGALYKELNDPMEGKFSKKNLSKDDLEKIYGRLKNTRICSLLTKQDQQDFPDDFLMWSHYADSHKGYCVELQVTGRNNSEWDLLEVQYSETLPILSGTIDDKIKKYCQLKTQYGKMNTR